MWNALYLALVSELVYTLLVVAFRFVLPFSLTWLTAPVDCGCRRLVTQRSTSRDIVHDVMDTKRRGRDGAPSMMLW